MNFRKLLTYLTVGTAAVIPFAGAQNPTILQGSYISNVFGNSNFVLNPNAQTNVANVTNATRVTTTPLVATSEFNLNLTSGTFATWTLRAFDSGMKGQNCEARFSYRGFATATTKAEIVQNSLVVAHLTLTPSTDPRIASINFPCGDLVNATTFRIAQTTANMTVVTPNEIGGIYVGLATNMANVAQAEEVGSIFIGSGCNWDRTGAGSNSFGNFTANALCPTPVATGAADTTAGKIPGGKFNNLKPGKYLFMISYPQFKQGSISDWVGTRLSDGSTYGPTYFSYMQQTGELWSTATSVWQVEYTTVTSPTIQLQGKTENTANTIRVYNDSANAGGIRLTAYRFPSASELVVTPERQNTFGGVRIFSSGITNSVTAVSPTKLTTAGTATRTLYGKADSTATNDLSITIKNLPVGSFKVEATGAFYTRSTVSGQAVACQFSLSDSPTAGSPIAAMYQDAYGDATATTQDMMISSMSGVYVNTSVADRTFYVRALRGTGANGSCTNYSDDGAPTTIIVTPLDQPSNSALYVQGPVLGAQTGAAIPSGYQMEGVANANNLSLTNGQLIRDLSTFVPGVRVTQITRTLTPGNYLVTADISCDGMPSGIGLIVYMVADSTTFALSRNIAPTASAYVSNSVTRYLRVTNNMVYKVDAEAGGVISGSCATTSTVLRLN